MGASKRPRRGLRKALRAPFSSTFIDFHRFFYRFSLIFIDVLDGSEGISGLEVGPRCSEAWWQDAHERRASTLKILELEGQAGALDITSIRVKSMHFQSASMDFRLISLDSTRFHWMLVQSRLISIHFRRCPVSTCSSPSSEGAAWIRVVLEDCLGCVASHVLKGRQGAFRPPSRRGSYRLLALKHFAARRKEF